MIGPILNKTVKSKAGQVSSNRTPRHSGPAQLSRGREVTGQQSHITSKAPPVFRPNALPKVLQSKTSQTRSEAPTRTLARRVALTHKSKKQSVVQPFVSRIVQATKFYPNLHPGAVEPINQGNVFRLTSFSNQYRLHRVESHSVNVPNQQYNFVRTREGEMLLHARYRHPSIAEGKQVLYAGEIFFNNGQLEWWSNGSGHYQPYPEDAVQANLPMDQFFSYQQIIKGEHKRKR